VIDEMDDAFPDLPAKVVRLIGSLIMQRDDALARRDRMRAAIENLFAASDIVLGESWREDTLGQEDGDALNAAWDALRAELEE